jgi:hypothetical protein
MTPNELSPGLELRCDACAEPTLLYRLLGTHDALCGACFVRTYPSDVAVDRRRRTARTAGPAAAGCLRYLRTQLPVHGAHRMLGTPRR